MTSSLPLSPSSSSSRLSPSVEVEVEGARTDRAGKPPSASCAAMVYKIFPNDLNSDGTVFGGVILALMDRTALVVAERHSGKSCVTVSIDAVRFVAPGRKGENIVCTATITRSWTSSMEIALTLKAEQPFSGDQRLIVEAYFTFCAFDPWGRPTRTPVPTVLPQTDQEHHQYDEAEIRRTERLRATQSRKERQHSKQQRRKQEQRVLHSKL